MLYVVHYDQGGTKIDSPLEYSRQLSHGFKHWQRWFYVIKVCFKLTFDACTVSQYAVTQVPAHQIMTSAVDVRTYVIITAFVEVFLTGVAHPLSFTATLPGDRVTRLRQTGYSAGFAVTPVLAIRPVSVVGTLYKIKKVINSALQKFWNKM